MDIDYYHSLRNANPFLKTQDAVYQVLREAILEEQFPAEKKINVSGVAEKLQISRTPVREALERLRIEGMVLEREEKNGYFPVTITRSQIEDLFFARKMIEGNAAYLCALQREGVALEELKDLAVAFRNCFRNDDFTNFDEIDRRFHTLLIHCCQNHYFQRMYDSLNDPITLVESRMRRILAGKSLAQKTDSFALQHLNIVHSIEMGIPSLAMQAANSHIDACIDYIRRYYNEY